MGNPMPLAERFCPGTSWVLSVGAHGWAPGTRVVVQGDLAPSTGYDMVVPVSFPDETVADVSIEILG